MGKLDKRRMSRDVSRTDGSAESKWRRHAWRLLAIWALIFIGYSNSFQAGLVFDNASVIGEDPRIREATPQNIESILSGGYWYGNSGRPATAGLYRPLTTFSYLLNYAVLGEGPRPAGYHWANLILHEINVSLVYLLALLIFGEAMPALALAAVWGVHPLLTESVTNIVGRADLLAAFGVLSGLLCHIRGASATGRRRLAWLVGLVAAQTIGLLSKENAAVLPGVMLLYDLVWPGTATWRRRVSAYAALALPFAVFLYLRSGLHTHMVPEFLENPLVGASFWTARLTAVKVIGKFLWLFLWPGGLSADYSFNAIPLFGWRLSNWEDAKVLIALAICLGAATLAVLLAVRWRQTGKVLLFFLGFLFVALAPTSNLFLLIGSIMAERFYYLPSVALAGCLVAAILMSGRRHSRLAWGALGLVCLACTVRTYARNIDWQDDRSLWASAVASYPESARPHYNLALELERTPDRLPEAITEYEATLRIQPDHAQAHNNLANALAQMPGRLLQAIAEYQAALRLRPDLAMVHYNLANVLAQVPGRLPDAVAEYETALRIQPDHADAYQALANALAQLPGRLPDAIAEYQAALRIQPDHAVLHYNLANALAQSPAGLQEAIDQYRAALRIRPDFLEAHVNLGNTLARTPGRRNEAIAEYEAALAIQPDRRLQQILETLRAGR